MSIILFDININKYTFVIDIEKKIHNIYIKSIERFYVDNDHDYVTSDHMHYQKKF